MVARQRNSEEDRIGNDSANERQLLRRLEALVDGFEQHQLIVFGDVMLDEYLFGSAERLSPEAPVPIVHIGDEYAALGGAGNVARNVAALGAGCALVGVVGDDEAGRRVQAMARKHGLGSAGLVVDSERPTSHKTRLVARGQQVIRFDRESTGPLAANIAERVFESLIEASADANGALGVDYAKGTLSPDLATRSIDYLSERGIVTAVDPKTSLARFRGAQLVKPNLAEAVAMAGLPPGDPIDWSLLFDRLSSELANADIAVTCGSSGMRVQPAGGSERLVATWPREVFDVQGAGDTSLVSLLLARLSGATMEESAVIANAAAGVVVGKLGTAVAGRDEIRARLPQALTAYLETE